MRACALVLTLAGLHATLRAHDSITTKITWTREVSRIVYKRCASCHQKDGSAFSLIVYTEVRPWAKAIQEQVMTRRMPPWNAVKGFGEFKNDVGLTQEEIEIIGAWVDGGAPEGNPLYLPAAPHVHPVEGQEEGGARSVEFSGFKVTEQAIEAIGIQPTQAPTDGGGVLQAIAQLPDGRIEPLLWVHQFNPSFNGPYFFRNTLRFPKGTKIEVMPPAGRITLFLKQRKTATSIPKPGR